MPKVSISQAWDETRAILARDSKLISAVALALLVLPGVAMAVFMPGDVSVAQTQQLGFLLVFLVVFIVTFIGQLSVVRMAMGPHISVGDAIRHAASRVLPFLGAFLLWVMPVLMLAAVPYGIIRNNPTQPPLIASLGFLAIMIIGTFVGVRLMLIGPVATGEHGGSFMILRRSWTITAGNWWRLFGFLLIFGIGALALLWAVKEAFGIVARLLIGSVSEMSVPGLILILVAQVLTAAIYVVLFVMQARIYTQLARGGERETSVPSSR